MREYRVTMGRTLIGCCHWAAANERSPHSDPKPSKTPPTGNYSNYFGANYFWRQNYSTYSNHYVSLTFCTHCNPYSTSLCTHCNPLYTHCNPLIYTVHTSLSLCYSHCQYTLFTLPSSFHCNWHYSTLLQTTPHYSNYSTLLLFSMFNSTMIAV